MKVVLIDDEKWVMEQFEYDCNEYSNVKIVGKFQNPKEALVFIEKNPVDVAFLDVEMVEMNGIELGRRIRELNDRVMIVYITGYDKYIKEAILDVKAEYYLLKPYSKEELFGVLEKIECLCTIFDKRVQIQCFGNFDVFIDGKVVAFSNAKAKELLALCVNQKGGVLTMEKAISYLWEEREYDSKVKGLYRKAVIYLHSLFREYGIEDIFQSGRGVCFIDKEKVACDFFDYISDNTLDEKEPLFLESYMAEYSWAEATIGELLF